MFVFLIGILIGLWAGQQFNFIPNLQQHVTSWMKKQPQVQDVEDTNDAAPPFKGTLPTTTIQLSVPEV